jgi:hypothetical protein
MFVTPLNVQAWLRAPAHCPLKLRNSEVPGCPGVAVPPFCRQYPFPFMTTPSPVKVHS